jgi:protein involved in polysaccharide export with SLBB domain
MMARFALGAARRRSGCRRFPRSRAADDRRLTRAAWACCALVAALAIPAAARAQQPPAPAAAAADSAPMYRLVPGDTLDVKFDFVPELNENVKVRPDGYISLQRIGEVRVQGRTASELTELLETRYAEILKRPDLTVIVRDYVAQQTFVGGEVMAPGVVTLRGQVTMLQAIMQTGGLRPSARVGEVLLIRDLGDNRAEARKVDLRQVLEGKVADTVLQPFDIVFVPRSKIAQVGLFVEQYVNALIPQSFFFPYNLNSIVYDQAAQ